MKRYLILTVALVALLVSSCSPFQVHTDYSQLVNFSTYKTYQLRVDDLKINDLDKDRVLSEISKQLQAKGLRPAENPDVIVDVTASHKEITDVESYGRPYGYWGWGYPWGWGFGMGNTWTSHYNQGTLNINIIDRQSNKLVWQGIGKGIMVDSPQKKQKQIPELIGEMMANYPPIKR